MYVCNVCMHVGMCVMYGVFVSAHVCNLRVYMCNAMHACLYVCMYAGMYACMSVGTCV